MPPGLRIAISQKQRQLLRKKRHENPLWTQAQLGRWAEVEFKHKLSQSTISESLSNRYAHLDRESKVRDIKKARRSNFPILEEALAEALIGLNGKGAPVTGDVIKGVAAKLWVRLEDYRDQPLPLFSTGWLDGFKARYSIRRYRRHGEARALTIDCSQDLYALQQAIKQYDSDDVYNADETALYWKATPNYTLATTRQSGGKDNKTQVTILPCSNTSGRHRLDLWIIGTAASPQAFGRNNSRIAMHPIQYRSNKTAWVSGKIFLEWLLWFDNQMQGRNVLLLLDNFSAHQRGVKDAVDRGLLRNTRVAWLPADTTSLHQPMDQGIINNLKVYYKRYWFEFIADALFHDRDPMAEVTLLRALGWIIQAWREGIKNQTINACWVKSQLFGALSGPHVHPPDWDESRNALRELLGQARIRSLMQIDHMTDFSEATLDSFIEPEERVVDSTEDILDQVASQFSSAGEEDDEENLTGLAPVITNAQASEAFSILVNFEEQREDADFTLLQTLYTQQRAFLANWRRARDQAKQQST